MKSLACLLLVVVALPATAQQTQELATTLISFHPQAGIAWSNTLTNAYSMVEWTPLLSGVWNPFVLPGVWVTGFVGRVGNEGILSNLWNQVSSLPGPLFFRVRSSESEITNIVETTRLRVHNQTQNTISNVFLQVKNHQGWWVGDWSVPEIAPGQTTCYNDFVIEWEMIMTSWVGYIKGSYQTTGETPSVWLDPWPHCFTVVIDGAGYHKE